MNHKKMKLAWLTDIHLNFLERCERVKFYDDILETHCDAALISGDIAEAPSLTDLRSEMANHLKRPIVKAGKAEYYQPEIQEIILI